MCFVDVRRARDVMPSDWGVSQEDELVIKYVSMHGTKRWAGIATVCIPPATSPPHLCFVYINSFCALVPSDCLGAGTEKGFRCSPVLALFLTHLVVLVADPVWTQGEAVQGAMAQPP
eukprot:716726-Rhodomonas_salina.2